MRKWLFFFLAGYIWRKFSSKSQNASQPRLTQKQGDLGANRSV